MRLPVIFGNPEDRKSVYDRAGKRIAFWIRNTPVTPNQITLFRYALAPFIFYSLYRAEYSYFVIAAILCEIALLLDCVDGSLARLKKMESKFGCWMEKNVDYLLFYDFTLFGFFLALAIYKTEQSVFIWVILFFNIFGHLFNKVFLDEYIKLADITQEDIAKTNRQRKGILRNIWVFIQWYDQFIVLCLLLYEPLYYVTGINPLFFSMVLIAFVRYIQWIQKVVKTFVFFQRNKFS